MAETKTKPTAVSVTDYLATVEPERRRKDGQELLSMMREVTGLEPSMWGPSMIGFGSYHYKYESGHEGDAMMIGFAPRKANLVLYIMASSERHEELISRLGKCKKSKGCLYINKLDDIDRSVLHELIAQSFAWVKENQRCDVCT